MEHLYVLPVLLFSIVIHELAHGWMALKLGDSTARDLGRLTLNPIPHIDPLGSIIIPLVSFLSAGTVLIAWAKPVPINPMNFHNYRRDDILVSVVGPLSNLVMAFVCTLAYIGIYRIVGPLENLPIGAWATFLSFCVKMFAAGITLNIFLAVFNLLPVPPLDGSHVVSSLLPPALGERFRQIGFAGILIIILLMRVEPVRNLLYATVTILREPYVFLIQLLT